MNSILRIYVPSKLNVVAQHTEVLIIALDLTLDISKQPTFHNQVHYFLRIRSSCKYPKTLLYMQPLHKIFVVKQSRECKLPL